jgi:hypothetical protein
MSSFIGCEQGKVIIEKYDKKSLFPMPMKCYYHFASIGWIWKGCCWSKGWRG